MSTLRNIIGVALLVCLLPGCIDLDVPIANDLFATGTSFVVRGTAAMVGPGGNCLGWVGENGAIYHLFQDPRVLNEDFDRITTPGVTSRIKIAIRSDLYWDCAVGPIVEVQDILEIVD